MDASYPWSGQDACFDMAGLAVSCAGSGQDGEYRPGRPWPDPRFEVVADGLVKDRLTGLFWPKSANPAGWPLTFPEATALVRDWNAQGLFGRDDWRLPLRRELLSLVSLVHARPALPPGHPFVDVFQHWCWTGSASAVAPGYAWRVHLEGGRMFPGPGDAAHLVWPVSGTSWLLPEASNPELLTRFSQSGEEVCDRLTGLVWARRILPETGETNWGEALEMARQAARQEGNPWRLPTIWELESLADVSRAWPALPQDHPFEGIGPAPGNGRLGDIGLWSGTTSGYDPAWAWVLYAGKGAVGVGHKQGGRFQFLLTRGQARKGPSATP